METLVCIRQTALDLLEMEYDVHLVVDAVSSISLHDRNIAIESPCNWLSRGAILVDFRSNRCRSTQPFFQSCCPRGNTKHRKRGPRFRPAWRYTHVKNTCYTVTENMTELRVPKVRPDCVRAMLFPLSLVCKHLCTPIAHYRVRLRRKTAHADAHNTKCNNILYR